LKVSYIRGEHDQDERKRALTKLEQGKIDVLIGTTILDVGVDVPAVGLVCLAGGGKAEVALRQRIGRGLRAKKRGPNVAFIMDFNDGMNSYLIDHCRQRRLIIEGTEGFAERILPPGKDFPWELFAEERQAA
jgi:superfamily II DNA or RNA helicase